MKNKESDVVVKVKIRVPGLQALPPAAVPEKGSAPPLRPCVPPDFPQDGQTYTLPSTGCTGQTLAPRGSDGSFWQHIFGKIYGGPLSASPTAIPDNGAQGISTVGKASWMLPCLPVPNCSPTGQENTLVMWYFDGTNYTTSLVHFTAVCPWLSGSGSNWGHMSTALPAHWMLEISGLPGPLAVFNNIYLLKCLNPSALSWENGGCGKARARVSMKYEDRSEIFKLLMRLQEASYSAQATALAPPFGSLRFTLPDVRPGHDMPRIVATPVPVC